MQVDDDGFGGQRGTVPLAVALSIGATFLATVAAIGFVTVQHVESSAPYGVAVRAPASAPAAPSRPVKRAAVPPAAAPSRTRVHRVRHLAAAPKAHASALPRPQAARSAEVAAYPMVVATARHHASRPHRAILAESPEGRMAGGAAAAPVVLTATTEATVASSQAVATDAPAAAAAPPVDAPAPAPTEAAIAAPPAPEYAPERVVEARVKLAAEPEFPSDPSVVGLRGTSAVLVTIGPQGSVVKVALDRSSGHEAFDQAALSAARRSLYAAPEIDGKPATASYRMVYDFGQ